MKEWLVARQWILPAVTDEDDTEPVIVARLLAGTAQLWLGSRSAMVTEMNGDPRALHVWLGGGDLHELLSFTPGVAAYARTWGCSELTLQGRKGWARALRHLGFVGEEILRMPL